MPQLKKSNRNCMTFVRGDMLAELCLVEGKFE